MVIADHDHHIKSRSQSSDILSSLSLLISRVPLERRALLGGLALLVSQDGPVLLVLLGLWARKASQ